MLVAKKAVLVPWMYSTLWKKYEYSLALHLLNFADCNIWKDASVLLLKKIVESLKGYSRNLQGFWGRTGKRRPRCMWLLDAVCATHPANIHQYHLGSMKIEASFSANSSCIPKPDITEDKWVLWPEILSFYKSISPLSWGLFICLPLRKKKKHNKTSLLSVISLK